MKPQRYSQLSQPQRAQLRQQYIEHQRGNCYYCKQPLAGRPIARVETAEINWNLFPPLFKHSPVHLHHDHGTDLTIGAVHMRCNAYMWCYLGE